MPWPQASKRKPTAAYAMPLVLPPATETAMHARRPRERERERKEKKKKAATTSRPASDARCRCFVRLRAGLLPLPVFLL